MAKYSIEWPKTYTSHGVFEIEADNESAAESVGFQLIGDQTGSLNYIPEEDYLCVLDSNTDPSHPSPLS